MSIVLKEFANGQVYQAAIKCDFCPPRRKPQSCIVITDWKAHSRTVRHPSTIPMQENRIALCRKFHAPELSRIIEGNKNER